MTSSVNPYEPPQPVAPPLASDGTLPVRVMGVLTPQDGIGALRAVGKWNPWKLRIFLVGSALIVVGLLLLNPPAGGVNGLILTGIAIFALGLLGLVIAPLNARRKFNASWNVQPQNMHPIVWTFSVDGLLIEAIHSKHLIGWPSFLYARITDDQLIFAQHGETMFHFIPRRFFNSDAEWQAISQLLAAKLPVR